ncbi:hypothetical protein [Nonomuraea basaltis]|uniref:hypothetical protein n=1 Tax=Nonomuraea basaltis TaxID=2495887 RepID=UPI00198188C8|nr:hypothetical protein [Nonomuraea basaltis]
MPARTMADTILDVRINDSSHGEIGINTLLAGSNGCPSCWPAATTRRAKSSAHCCPRVLIR